MPALATEAECPTSEDGEVDPHVAQWARDQIPSYLVDVLVEHLHPLAWVTARVPQKTRREALITLARSCNVLRKATLALQLSSRLRRWEKNPNSLVLTQSQRRSHLLALANATGCRAPCRLAVKLDQILRGHDDDEAEEMFLWPIE
ncbi:hypothetical protein AURDEDRAFT_172355 [Auricularia subglabra TFB-10046 SS5]|nr:hypothetical protein AURDEDRAFT_172355 [Auricularia subglabra TFB-10046 SS5]